MIFLIGYSYSGKSTLGRQLAQLLGYNLFDTDRAIEEKYRTSIPLIFTRYGEEAFRIMERQILLSTVGKGDTIMATGGGTACCEENIQFMLKHGIVIHLEMSVDDILKRYASSHKTRPLLQGMTDAQRRNYIEQHLAQRLPYYRQAHISIPAITATAESLRDLLNLPIP